MSNTTTPNESHWQALVLLLAEIAREKGITYEEISQRTGYSRSNISRIMNLHYCPSVKIFLQIASAIGVNFFFEDKEGKTDLTTAFEKAMEELGRRADKLPKN